MSPVLQDSPRAINPDELYHIDEARRRLLWGPAAMRTARANGLKVKYVGGRAYLLGSEIIRYVMAQDEIPANRGG